MVKVGQRVKKKKGFESAPTLVRVSPKKKNSRSRGSRGRASPATFKAPEELKVGFGKVGSKKFVEAKVSTIKEVKRRTGRKSTSRRVVEQAARIERQRATERAKKAAAEKASRIAQEARRRAKEQAKKSFLQKQIESKRREVARVQKQLDQTAKRVRAIRRQKPTKQNQEELRKIRGKQIGLNNQIVLAKGAERILESVEATPELVKAVGLVLKNPRKNLVPISKKAAQSIKADIVDTGQLFKTAPTQAIAKVGTDIFLLKAVGKGFKVTGKVGGAAKARLNPKFAKVTKEGKITTRAITPSKRVELQLGTIGKGVPLKQQVGFAGKKVTAASVQTDRIVNFVNRKKIIRKPIPGQDKLKPRTKKLLEKFDKAKISKKDFIELNDRVLSETGKSMLERSLFADPTGKVRFTRLAGQVPEARLKDIITGNFQLKKPKPQILVFKDLKVAKFPKNLADVKKKLLANKPLTKSEATRLVRWQTKTSGRLKPIGDTKFKGGKELEVTIAPGELIKRKKKLGVTRVDGQTVEIIQADIFKPKGRTKTLVTKAKKGTINKKEITELNKRLSKETGFKSVSRRRAPTTKPVLRKPGVRPTPRKRPTPRRKTTPRKRPTPRKPTVRTPRPKPTRPRPRPRPVARPVARPRTKKPPVIVKAKRRKRKAKRTKKGQAYKVTAKPIKTLKGKQAKRSIKVSKVPLSKTAAKNLRNYVADTSLARTAEIKPTKGKPTKGKLKVPAGYAKKTTKKFRKYRTVKGKKKPLPKGKVIERKKRLLDTKQEKQKITLRKRIKQLEAQGKKPTPRRKPITKKKVTQKRKKKPTKGKPTVRRKKRR